MPRNLSENTRVGEINPSFLPVISNYEKNTNLEIETTQTGRETSVLHSVYEMADGSSLAFFEAPDQPFEFKKQHDFDLHIALEVSHDFLLAMFEKGKKEGIETRGISDHGFIDSIYFRDPNGYVIELTAKKNDSEESNLVKPAPEEVLSRWQSKKVI